MQGDDFYQEMIKRNIGVYTLEEQDMLRKAKVVICGLGGVGGYEAILCTRMGIGNIIGVDMDSFDISNINRQMLASTVVLGEPKALVAEKMLREINPLAEIKMIKARVDENNAVELLSGHDIILEAVDDMPSRVVIHRTARELGIPSIGMSGSPPNRGFISSFFPDGISYEVALGLPSVGKKLSDKELCRQIADIKKKRALYSVKLGAPISWANNYCEGKDGWIITPVRAHLISLFSFHEAVQILTGREPLARAPKGILINLDNLQYPVRIEEPPDNRWDYTML